MKIVKELLLWLPRRFWNWCLEHGRFVFPIWAVLGTAASIWVINYRPDEADEILKKMQEFADPSLPTSVGVGALLVVGGLGLLRRFSTSSYAEGVADELSDAATNFVAICCVLFALRVLLQKPIEITSLRAPAAALFVAIVFCKVRSNVEKVIELREQVEEVREIEVPTDYGFEFTYPAENELIGESTIVKGTAKIEPSDGSEIWLFRRWDGFDYECYPLARIILIPNGNTYEWTVPPSEGFIGGRPGKNDKRYLEVWLVGPEGLRVVRHFKKWEQYLNGIRETVNLLRDEVNDRRKQLDVAPLQARIDLVSRGVDVRDIPRDTTCKAKRVVVRA